MLNLFSVVLILAGLMSLVVFILNPFSFVPMYVGIIFILVAFFNAFLEFYQELKSKHVLEGFRSLLEQNTKVIRSGELIEIPIGDVVVGDIISLKAGDTVPADARVIACRSLKVDMSSLTGESVPVERNADISDLSPDRSKNLIFKASAITTGTCEAIVIRVGQKTFIGVTMKLSMGEIVEEGELGKELAVLIRRIVLAALITGSIFMGAAFIQGLGVVPAFEAAIGIFVAFLPQGLPMTITILLTSAATRMATENVLVKNLQAVETFGSLTVIATDKTGTLTKAQMQVVGGWVDGEIFEDNSACENISRITNCYSKCSTIRLSGNGKLDEELNGVFGDPTELGLLRYALRCGVKLENHNALVEIPFDSSRKWNMTVVKQPDGTMIAYMKGAPDRLVGVCDVEEQFKEQMKRAYIQFARDGQRLIGFAEKRLRKESELTQFKGDPSQITLSGFEFLGMLSIYDPPKEGVKEAVEQLEESGIKVIMVTGDHPVTAKSIARLVSILTTDQVIIIENTDQLSDDLNSSSIVIHGDLVDVMSESQWKQVLTAKEIVFARTLPRHKLIIVRQLQSQGEIVGAVGDGVNDSPAIKRANLGISMNKTGSDMSKDAASIILLDDRFATIVKGVLEGRLIYQNLKKSIRYTLTHIFPEVAAFSAWVLFLIPPPLTPILVLMIDVGSELGPALSYAYEPAELDLLSLRPRKHLRVASAQQRGVIKRILRKILRPFKLDQKGEGLIDSELVRWVYLQGGIIEALGCFGAYIITFVMHRVPLSSIWKSEGIYLAQFSRPLRLTNGTFIGSARQLTILHQANGVYYLAIIIGQLFNLFLCKSRYTNPFTRRAFRNKATFLGALCAMMIGGLVVFVPGLQVVFVTSSIIALSIAAPIATGFLMLLYSGLKTIFNKYKR